LLALGLHGSIDAVVQLGPFSWAMVAVFLVFVTREDWEWLEQKLRARTPERVLLLDAKDGFSLTVARIVKRLDWLGRVRFEALPAPARPAEPPADAGSPESDAAPEPQSPAPAAAPSLAVGDESGQARWTGWRAIWRLGDALWLPRIALAWLWLPPFRGLLDRALERASLRREELTRALGLEELPGSDWQAEPPSEARQLVGGVGRAFGNLVTLLVMVACGSQVLIENHAVPPWLKPRTRPEWMTAIVIYPRLFQGWSMFAPQPPMEDGRVVVDGRTADGRKLDPLTGMAPSFEVQPRDGFRMNQIWGDFHRRIGEPRFSAYLQGVRDMLVNYHQITGRPEDRLVAFDLWYVTEQIPPPGAERRPASRRKLLSHGAMRDPAPAVPR
jgi:hypothetical protein